MTAVVVIHFQKGRAEFRRGSILLFTMRATNNEEWVEAMDMFKVMNENLEEDR